MAGETKTRGRVWLHKETLLLLENWGHENIQPQLKSCTRTKPIWLEIAAYLRAAGCENRDDGSCKTRIHILISALANHYRSSFSRSPPKRIETCFYSKLEVNFGRIEIVAASTTIKIQMTQDICGGGIGRVVSLQAFRDFPQIFRLSSLRVFQNKSAIFHPSAILFTFYMLWLYDVVTFYVNYNYTNARRSMNMRLHCCLLLLIGVNV